MTALSPFEIETSVETTAEKVVRLYQETKEDGFDAVAVATLKQDNVSPRAVLQYLFD